jgi:hypothetical protein
MSDFKLDRDGNIPTKPLVGWTIGQVGGVALLLEAQYAQSPEELETEQQQTLCLALSIPLALQLADALKRHAEKLLNESASQGATLH